jgi:hypothetical protein
MHSRSLLHSSRWGNGYQRAVGANSTLLNEDVHFISALERMNNNGPWTNPEALRKTNALLSLAQGSISNGVVHIPIGLPSPLELNRPSARSTSRSRPVFRQALWLVLMRLTPATAQEPTATVYLVSGNNSAEHTLTKSIGTAFILT